MDHYLREGDTWWGWNRLYYIDRRTYLNLSKSTQIAAGLVAFETCRQWALLNVRIITLLFSITVQKYIYFFLLSAKCMLGLFVFP